MTTFVLERAQVNSVIRIVSLAGASFIFSFSGRVLAQDAPQVTVVDQRSAESVKYYRDEDAIICLFAGTANGKEIKVATYAPYKVSAFAFRVDTSKPYLAAFDSVYDQTAKQIIYQSALSVR